MAKAALPRNGSSESVLREHLNKIAVWRVLLLFGTYKDQHTEQSIARRLKAVGADVPADQVTTLYHLAVSEAEQATKRAA